MAGRRDIFEKAVNEGNSAAWDQQWEQAVAAYRAALGEFPDDTGVLSNLGLALLAMNKPDEALIVYQHTARLSPGDSVAIEKSAEILEQLGRASEAALAYLAVAEIHAARRDAVKAIENWSRAAEMAPDNLQAHLRLATAYDRTNRPAEAIAEYLTVARLVQQQGDGQKALQAAQRAVQIDPRNNEAMQAVEMIQRGVALPAPQRKRGGTGPLRKRPFADFAKEAATSGEAHKPEKKSNPMVAARDAAMSKLASLLFDIGDDESETTRQGQGGLFKKAITDPFKNARDNKAQIITYVTQAIDVQTKGDLNAAAAFYEKALRAGMEHGALNYTLAAAYFDLERYTDAIKQFQPATNHLEYAAGAHFGLGLCYGRDGEMADAVSHLLDCLRLVDMGTVQPRQADSLSGLYENFQESLERSNQSEEELTKIGENLIAFLSGPDWQNRVGQARQRLNSQQDADAGMLAPLAEMLYIPGAEHVMEVMNAIEKYMSRKWLDTAMNEAHRGVELSPTYLPIHLKIAEILVAQNKTEAAIAKYNVIAELYRVRGESLRAGKMYEQMVRLAPMDLDIRAKLIDLLMAQGRIEDAVRQHLDMAVAHQDLADLEKARQTYAEALRLAQSPGVDRSLASQALHCMGDIDIQRLDWRQALRTYEQIKVADPNDSQARATLIDLHFRLGQARQALVETDDWIKQLIASGNIAGAAAFIESLVDSRTDDIGLRSRLVRLYQQTGRKADAIAQLETIGDLQIQAGRKADAAQTIQAILALGPDDPASYQQLLAELQASG
ncbi:MAG: tetratricopeptide repeat protein [Chloroflexi bacterium]|nr:tetratricopeptide repeat protein [Chloroflexota bacterium]